MKTAHRSETQWPTDVRDIRNAAEHHLFRGMAIAQVVRCLVWQYENAWEVGQPFTLHDLEPHDLRIALEVMTDELQEASALLGKVEPV
jgi:hypothetical protein